MTVKSVLRFLEADVNFKVVKTSFVKNERALRQCLALSPAQQVVKIVNEELPELMVANKRRSWI